MEQIPDLSEVLNDPQSPCAPGSIPAGSDGTEFAGFNLIGGQVRPIYFGPEVNGPNGDYRLAIVPLLGPGDSSGSGDCGEGECQWGGIIYVQPYMKDPATGRYRRIEEDKDTLQYKDWHGSSGSGLPKGVWSTPSGGSGTQGPTSEFRFDVSLSANCPGTTSVTFTITGHDGLTASADLTYSCFCLTGG